VSQGRAAELAGLPRVEFLDALIARRPTRRVADAAVVDSSPLILLARAGPVGLLRGLAPVVLVPAAVVAEIRAKQPDDSAARALDEAAWLTVAPTPLAALVVARWDLRAGESAVLTLAAGHPGGLPVLDDRLARRRARQLGIPTLGTAPRRGMGTCLDLALLLAGCPRTRRHGW
jgi:predicted nucleic acid-binding protein